MRSRHLEAGPWEPVHAKRLAAFIGAAAAVALGLLGYSATAPLAVTADIPLAGSGSAPMNTTFTQPVVSGMSLGNTGTATTPPSAPVVSVATPPVKASH
jgi:hypothetical protein